MGSFKKFETFMCGILCLVIGYAFFLPIVGLLEEVNKTIVDPLHLVYFFTMLFFE